MFPNLEEKVLGGGSGDPAVGRGSAMRRGCGGTAVAVGGWWAGVGGGASRSKGLAAVGAWRVAAGGEGVRVAGQALHRRSLEVGAGLGGGGGGESGGAVGG